MCITGDCTASDERFDEFLSRLAEAPPDYLEIRDKAASDRRLTALLSRARTSLPRSRILSNARFDLALASGAAGVILPETGLPISPVRRETPRGFLIGKSTHSAAAVRKAADEGADLVLLGPIFETPSKARFGPPLSPSVLRDLPPQPKEGAEVFLVGGIGVATLPLLREYRDRFAGVAAIRAFEMPNQSAETVAAVRAQ